jgi:hypothetical protein
MDMTMVARTIPFKPREKPKMPDWPPSGPSLPSIPQEDMEQQQRLSQTPAEQLRHAQEQIALTRQYPGRVPPRE